MSFFFNVYVLVKLISLSLSLSLTVKYVGSFPVDDRCLDDQIERLHTQLKSLKVSPEPRDGSQNDLLKQQLVPVFTVCCLQSDVQEEEARIHQVLHQGGETVQ